MHPPHSLAGHPLHSFTLLELAFPLSLLIMPSPPLPPPPPFSSFFPPPPLLSSSPPPLPTSPFDPLAASFRPSIAVIIGVLTTMFSLTFLLLLYAKHCKRHGIGIYDRSDLSIAAGSPAPPPPLLRGRNSGLDRAIIDILPTFSFASLHGLKDGLECAVCLSRFDVTDVLRLLPKCKHAFHLECVDTWLSSHSTCPLCRNRVEADDVFIVEDLVAGGKCSSNEVQQPARNSGAGRPSSAGRNSNAEEAGIDRAFQVYVQRESGTVALQPSPDVLGRVRYPSRKESICRSSSRKSEHGNRRPDSLLQTMDFDEHEFAKRFGHRIIISDALSQHRWSDFEGSALFLSSQTLLAGLQGTVGNRSGRTETIDLLGRPSTSSSFIRSSSVRLDGTLPSSNDIDGKDLQQGLHRSLSGELRLPNSRIQDVFLSRLSTSRNYGKAEFGLLHPASDGDVEVATESGKQTKGEAKAMGVFERQASFLRRAFATGRPDCSSSVEMPSYQRSVSEVSGIRRYAESGKSNSNGDEEANKQWLSIARKTLTWIMGGGKGRPFHQVASPPG